jgi:hypothetical protein
MKGSTSQLHVTVRTILNLLPICTLSQKVRVPVGTHETIPLRIPCFYLLKIRCGKGIEGRGKKERERREGKYKREEKEVRNSVHCLKKPSLKK